MQIKLDRSLPRLEDIRLIQGNGRYTDDLAPKGGLRSYVVRSPHAHAAIKTVCVDAALNAPGVRAILTAADYRADGHSLVRHAANPPGAVDPSAPWFTAAPDTVIREWGQPPLAEDRVRYVGEAIAFVVADTLAHARDAAELVEVEYDVLPTIVREMDAYASEAPQLWTDAPRNLSLSATLGDKAALERIFAEAHLVLERTFRNQRIVNCQMEPRSAFSSFDENEGYTVVAGSQGVMRQRRALAQALGVPPSKMRVISPDVGGGFGPRTALNLEVVLVAWASRKLQHPVRWTSDRTEAFLVDYQGRGQTTRAAIAVNADGRILAMKSEQFFNLGAYPVSFAPAGNGQKIVPTCYDIGNVLVETRGVLTNTAPTAPYRGAGRPEAHFALERLIDMAAERLGIDRIEMRRRNLIPKSRMPYRTATGLTYDSGDLIGNMNQALESADWVGFEKRRTESASRNMMRGIGVANYIESPVGAQRERVVLTVKPEGTVEVISGTQSSGQGHETTFAQVAAALLDIDVHQVRLVTGDTRLVTEGGGSHSDRSARLMGALLDRSCHKLIGLGQDAAALLFEVAPEKVTFEKGRFTTFGHKGLSIFEIAKHLEDGHLPTQMGSSFTVTETIEVRIPAYPTGCAICELEVDPETGVVEIRNYTSVDDVGQPINPLVVDGQVHGGIAQGVGQALHEGIEVDEATGQVLGASFMDYGLPHADNLPSFNVSLVEDPTPNPDNRLRIKGGGEGGITPATAAVINALVDALKSLGVEHIEMPATPARVWAAIQSAREAQIL
jgi:aerobic carbon-monoxide dehydrogenase large subunit